MTKKKKGSALILAVGVIAMLLILSMSVISVTSFNRITTMSYNKINENKMMAQTGADNGLSILKESIITKIKNTHNSDSVLYNIASTNYGSSIIADIGLAPTITKILPGNNPKSFSVAFNVFGTPLTTDSAIQYGDCYVEYIDNIEGHVINKNTNEDTISTDPDKQDLNNYLDPADNIGKKCIKMTVIAVGKNNEIKRIDVYIDKNSISDFYLDKMAANTFTIINKTTDDSEFKPETTEDNNSYNIAGNIYFRGHSFNLNNSSKINIDGTINAKVANGSSGLQFTPSKMTDINGTTESGISNSNTQIPSSIRSFEVYLDGMNTQYKSMNMPFYPPLDAGAYDASGSNIMKQTDLINNNAYTLLSDSSINQVDLSGTGTPSPFMIIAKCEPDNEDGAVDFNQLIYGINDPNHRPSTCNGLRYFIKNATYKPDETIEMNGTGKSVFDFPDDSGFAKMFKMIVVYGNLNIDASTYTYDGLLEENTGIFDISNYRKLTSVNYFIICLGTVTIKGNFNIQNSSIFAKKIVFDPQKTDDVILNEDSYDPTMDTTSSGITTDTAVNISGIGTNRAINAIKNNLNNYYDSIPNNAWGYLDNIEKAKINEYLINNLPDQYGEGLKFNIIEWDEN